MILQLNRPSTTAAAPDTSAKETYTTLKRLQERDAAEWRVDDYEDALTDSVEKASREAVEYDESFKNPVIVLKDLSYIREHLDYGKWMNRRLHN